MRTSSCGKAILWNEKMTGLLQQAFEKAGQLSPDEQNALASLLLAELESENRWDELFRASGDQLEKLADEALAEHRAGKTEPLDPDKL
jgi:hypothetical protein